MKTQLTQDLLAAKKGLTYTVEALASTLENWERKEFEAVKADLESEIASLENRLKICF